MANTTVPNTGEEVDENFDAATALLDRFIESGGAFAQEVALAAHASREVVFTPVAFPQLEVHEPKLWWPAQYGEPVLLELSTAAGDIVLGGALGTIDITAPLPDHILNTFALFGFDAGRFE